MTAVSVRRMFSPNEASRNPLARADAISSSVQPPSGPTANDTVDGATLLASAPIAGRTGKSACATKDESLPRISRRDNASRRSERRILSAEVDRAKALSGDKAACKIGGRRRRDCCADSRRMRFQRSWRFPAVARRGLSVRAAVRGMISSAPSSVAFSRHHSKRSNFTIEIRSVTRDADSTLSIGSTSAKSI